MNCFILALGGRPQRGKLPLFGQSEETSFYRKQALMWREHFFTSEGRFAVLPTEER